MQHIAPVDDVRDHICDGDPCPCLPRLVEGQVVHNSYDMREVGAVVIDALNHLARALACHDHTWTDDEREAYEHAMHLMLVHWPEE